MEWGANGNFLPLDCLITDSLKVVDAVLRTETPAGPVWRRYNHDGHGQRDDGTAWDAWGTGQSWPLLTAERGMYALTEGLDADPYLLAMEDLASETGLLPEQVWDAPDLPAAHLFLGKPTGSAMPLVWAHAEYIKLLRSVADGQVFDTVAAVRQRYAERTQCDRLEIWKLNRQVKQVKPGYVLRIQVPRSFHLRWSMDGGQYFETCPAQDTTLHINYADVAIAPEQTGTIQFTFFWADTETWADESYEVKIKAN